MSFETFLYLAPFILASLVLHELAHYFGIDEDRLAELGYD